MRLWGVLVVLFVAVGMLTLLFLRPRAGAQDAELSSDDHDPLHSDEPPGLEIHAQVQTQMLMLKAARISVGMNVLPHGPDRCGCRETDQQNQRLHDGFILNASTRYHQGTVSPLYSVY